MASQESLTSKKDRPDPGLALGKILTRPCTGKRRKKASHTKFSSDETTALLGNGTPAAPKKPERAPPRPRWRDVLTPQSSIIAFAYAMLAMHSIAFDAILPVFLNRPYQEIEDPNVSLPFKFVGGFEISMLITSVH